MAEEQAQEARGCLEGAHSAHNCLRCGRGLRSPKSREKQMGPTCARKVAALMGGTDQQAMWPDETRAELEAKMKGDCKLC